MDTKLKYTKYKYFAGSTNKHDEEQNTIKIKMWFG